MGRFALVGTMQGVVITCCYWAGLLALVLVLTCCDGGRGGEEFLQPGIDHRQGGGGCDEIYVVKEGETLQSIGEKCSDPFIVEENPHIHDPDDVFPGLVIRIHSPNLRL